MLEVQSVTRAQLRTRAEIEFSKARGNFWAFRIAIHPELIAGDWPRDISHHLQKFYHDLENGKRPKLVISSPPQHGKSLAVTDLMAWAMGRNWSSDIRIPNSKNFPLQSGPHE